MEASSAMTDLMAMRLSYIQLRYFSFSQMSPYIFSSKSASGDSTSAALAGARGLGRRTTFLA